MAIDGRKVGLALSGGGFRATLFGLGGLWRLNEAGLLAHIDRISSVSGGSITAGLLAHRWSRLEFHAGRAANFVEEIAKPLRALCNHDIDVHSGLKGLLNPFRSVGDYLARAYDKHLFHGASTRDMPDASRPGQPRFVIYATNMQTGRSFRIRQDMLADWYLGTAQGASIPLAQAVAASSAFPPVFSPVVLKMSPDAWKNGRVDLAESERLRSHIVLTDGGVYDNMGLETLLRSVDVVLVSDAGAPFAIDDDPPRSLRQLGRVRDILIDQTRALRKRSLIDDFEEGRRRGAYWGIGSRIGDYNDEQASVRDTLVTGALAKIPTRLAGFDAAIQGRLVNWGYVLAETALRKRVGLQLAPSEGLPVPEAGLH